MTKNTIRLAKKHAVRLLRKAGNPVALAYAQGYSAGIRRKTSP